MRDSGIDRTIFRDELGEISKSCDISLIGYNALPNEVQSYIGLQQMAQVRNLIEIQRTNADKWQTYFDVNLDVVSLRNSNSNPNYWVYGILVSNKIKMIEKFREEGYYSSGVHINNNNYSVFGTQPKLKGVRDFYNSFIALPCGWWVEFYK